MTNHHDDPRLLEALKNGDDAAFETLVRSHGPSLLAVIRRYVRHEEDAQDALQETFLSAFRALPSFKGEARLSTWLHRIAVNAALMKLRARGRVPAPASLDDLLPSFAADGSHLAPPGRFEATPDEMLAREETRGIVRECVAALPEPLRNALLLRDIQGVDTMEAARLLGTTPGAVRLRVHRARQALRTLLKRRLEAPPPRPPGRSRTRGLLGAVS